MNRNGDLAAREKTSYVRWWALGAAAVAALALSAALIAGSLTAVTPAGAYGTDSRARIQVNSIQCKNCHRGVAYRIAPMTKKAARSPARIGHRVETEPAKSGPLGGRWILVKIRFNMGHCLSNGNGGLCPQS